MGFLGVRFEMEGGKITRCLKLVRIMPETSNLVSKQINICSLRKYTFSYQGPFNFADISIFLQKITDFWQKQYLYLQQQYESCVRDFLVQFSFFVRWKITINENISFTEYTSGTRLPDCSKLAINWKNDNGVTIFRHNVIVKLF